MASCPFWSIVHDEVWLNASKVLVLVFFLFSLLVNIYLLSGLENSDSLSWQPRYMLLKNLVVSDLLQSLTMGPPVLHCLFRHQTLRFGGWCLAQFFSGAVAIVTSLLTVVSMALERYVYTCHGIRYLVVMTNGRMYIFLTLIWLIGLAAAGTSTMLLLMGSDGFGHIISGFVCEPEVVQAQMKDSLPFETFNKVFVGSLLSFCLLVFLFSYGRMYQEARQVLQPFEQDNIRACRTVLFYLGIFLLQLVPSAIRLITMFVRDVDCHLLVAVLVLIPPCINPLAYGLRNAEVRQALDHLWGLRKLPFCQ
ncbi:olfactory receptor 14I1 [Electrophorus electricus]|uniref:olfactory receptor 14I1 n=1 Tax=Electrophorus electricus TaxID=8005 RepID=UPI0015D0912B|nr:olfactory receptor 14I1 [Electrophorus electricus]